MLEMLKVPDDDDDDVEFLFSSTKKNLKNSTFVKKYYKKIKETISKDQKDKQKGPKQQYNQQPFPLRSSK